MKQWLPAIFKHSAVYVTNILNFNKLQNRGSRVILERVIFTHLNSSVYFIQAAGWSGG